jgi:hypothetical protein
MIKEKEGNKFFVSCSLQQFNHFPSKNQLITYIIQSYICYALYDSRLEKASIDTHNIINFCIENNISEHNQSIVLEYLKDLDRSCLKEATLRNNEHFLRFLLTHTQTDLDKLTKRDVNDIQDAINDWTKKNGKPASATSKMQYKITFQRFLKGYGASSEPIPKL